MNFFFSRSALQWRDEKKILLMREVLIQNVLMNKPGSPEQGRGWQKVTNTLNLLDGFDVKYR